MREVVSAEADKPDLAGLLGLALRLHQLVRDLPGVVFHVEQPYILVIGVQLLQAGVQLRQNARPGGRLGLGGKENVLALRSQRRSHHPFVLAVLIDAGAIEISDASISHPRDFLACQYWKRKARRGAQPVHRAFMIRVLHSAVEELMNRTFPIIAAASVLFAVAAEKSLQLKDLPPAVQKAVGERAKGAEIKNISKEKEDGVTQYEIETMLNGKHRDFNVDEKGALLVVEDETTIDAIPAAAKAAIEKKVGAGKLGRVEAMKKGPATFYEAGYTSKDGKRHSVLVTAAGVETKD